MLVLLLACAPCPTFDEARVVLGEDAGAEMRRAVALGLADLEAWTGLDGVCVREVAVVAPGQLDPFAGMWRAVPRRVEVAAGLDPDAARRVVTHELCHALDWRLELSDQAPGVFHGEVYEGSAYYTTPGARRREHFADTCALGPADVALRDLLVAECGLDSTLGEDRQWLLDHLFLPASGQAWAAERAALAVEEDLAREAAPEAEALHPVQALGLRWSVETTPLREVATGALVYQLRAVGRDPRTLQLEVEVALPVPPVAEAILPSTVLVAGDDGLYVAVYDAQVPVLRVHLDGVEVMGRLWQDDAEEALAVHDGTLYAIDRDTRRLFLRDVLTGQERGGPAVLDGARLYPEQVELRGDTLRWIEGLRTIVHLDLATGQETTLDRPGGTWLYRAWPLGEGWLALLWTYTASSVLVVHDGTTWRLPEDPCAWLVDGMDAGFDDAVVDVDGAVWVERAPGWVARVQAGG